MSRDSARWTRVDLAVVVVLVATAAVIGAPILDGGWLTYLDNPPHIAEIRSLAGDGAAGWSRIAFAGLSLDTLHSPLFWRGLAGLDRLGVDIAPVYAGLACLGLAAPGVAIYAVARRRTSWPWAAALAYVVVIQRPAIVGTGSATGGMWTFYLAAGALILLADRLARPTTTRGDTAVIAALFGFIGLTHLFVLEAAVVLVVVHAAWTLIVRRTRPGAPAIRALIRRDAIAGGLALAASAAYWVPVMIGADRFDATQNLSTGDLAALLLTPTDVITVMSGVEGAAALPGYLESLPMAALIIGGIWAAVGLRRRDADVLPVYGLGLAVVIAALLLVAPVIDLTALGPVSWRFLYFVRIGCALAALALLARLTVRVGPPPPLARRRAAIAAVAGAAAISAGLVWGAPLRDDVGDPDGAELADVRALWRWLRAERRPDWGRVYLQDTFMAAPYTSDLVHSHVLALTLDETGVEPLGPFYGIVPAATAAHTLSEFGLVFGGPVVYRDHGRTHLNAPIGSWGVTHLVTATPFATRQFEIAGWPVVHRVGRFTVFRPEPAVRPAPVGVLHGRYLVVEVDSDTPIAHASHPFWRVARAPPGVRIEPSRSGRIAIAGVPPGRHTIVLEYRAPPVWPVSIAGWIAIALVALGHARAHRKQVGSSHA